MNQVHDSTTVSSLRNVNETDTHDEIDSIYMKQATHAYHQNLPPQYFDEEGVSLVTKFAHQKARAIVRLVHSIQLKEEMYNSDYKKVGGEEEEGGEGEEENNENNNDHHRMNDDNEIIRKCLRISSSMSSFESLKYGGITQEEMCHMFLHVLRLCSATITYNTKIDDNPDESMNKNQYTLKYDNVGQLYKIHDDGTSNPIFHETCGSDPTHDKDHPIKINDINESFALPTNARVNLLSFLNILLAKDRYLRAASNQSFQVPEEKKIFNKERNDSYLLVIHWKALLRMLLRTAPYLDHNQCSNLHSDSRSHEKAVLKRTVNMIQYSRRYFDQGLDIKQNILTDKTSKEVWGMFQQELRSQSHSDEIYRAIILLHMFHPSRCSSKYYVEVLPIWFDIWCSVDRCPDFDFLWINLFSRCRRYVHPDDYDWGPLRRRLLTLSGYWLQIPIGGKSKDKTLKRVSEPASRHIPSKLTVFTTQNSGLNFITKISKLLVFCCGKDDKDEENRNALIQNTDDPMRVSHGTKDLLKFFSFVGPYLNPSNNGAWTLTLGIMLHNISYEICRRIGRDMSQNTLQMSVPQLASKITQIEPFKQCPTLPAHEIVLILDAILPLCQQSLYSKSKGVSRAGETAILQLAQIDHKICAPLLDFAMRALDISSVTLSHQAPAALCTIERLILPSLKHDPSILLSRVPDILNLSLAGIDGNDQYKTTQTLILYKTLTSWLPVGHGKYMVDTISLLNSKRVANWRVNDDKFIKVSPNVCDSKAYWEALRLLPPESLLFQPLLGEPFHPESEETKNRMVTLAEQAGYAMTDWSLNFLDRIYGLFRAAGEQEKVGKLHRYATRRVSADDVARERSFTRILKETLQQFFAAMDENTFICASDSVRRFLIDETHPFAMKYASVLCESICAAREDFQSGNISTGIRNLILPLTSDIHVLSHNTMLYRIRCLAGAVRRAGLKVLDNHDQIVKTLEFAFAHSNKHIFKAGCKLLRHTLASQSESYLLCTDSTPVFGSTQFLGEPARINKDSMKWHVPSGAQIDFVAELLAKFVYSRIKIFCLHSDFVIVENDYEKAHVSKHEQLTDWRRCLRLIRYSLRGCAGILIEMESKHPDRVIIDCDPNELASKVLIDSSSQLSQQIILSTRERLSRFIINLLSLISKENSSYSMHPQSSKSEYTTFTAIIASDVKICKEVAAISQLLFVRRVVSHNNGGGKWKVQKGLSKDRVVFNHRNEILKVLQKAGCMTPYLRRMYSDGEEDGKSLPRRMISTRVEIFLHSFQGWAAREVPRRMRKARGIGSAKQEILFSSAIGTDEILQNMTKLINVDVQFQEPRQFFAINKYECLIDGAFTLASHQNPSIRNYGIRASQYAFSCFGWLSLERLGHLISVINLKDGDQNIKFGLLSCYKLSIQKEPALRKRLSEALQGVCLILTIPKVMRQILSSEKMRFNLIKALCETQEVISLLPTEEMQKIIPYFHQVFAAFRSRYYAMPKISAESQRLHTHCVLELIRLLEEKKHDGSDARSPLNWRSRVIVCWFIITLTDKEIFLKQHLNLCEAIWESCVYAIEHEIGQPLQKMALGLFGRLVYVTHLMPDKSTPLQLQAKLVDKIFVQTFCNALVYNHKEDKNVGGGHNAQWSLGVSDILKDAASNIAPTLMFPMSRMGRHDTRFKVSHVMLLHIALSKLEEGSLSKITNHFLSIAKDLAQSKPGEDQRNQYCTSAEIASGVFIALLNNDGNLDTKKASLKCTILPFLEWIVDIFPFNFVSAILDGVRYVMFKTPPWVHEELCSWVVTHLENCLWSRDLSESAASATDGFSTQSKWLSMVYVILIENNFQTDYESFESWTGKLYCMDIYAGTSSENKATMTENQRNSYSIVCNRLLPRLLDATGHPYQSCRARIAFAIFYIAYSFRNRHGYQLDYVENPYECITKAVWQVGSLFQESKKEFSNSQITIMSFLRHCIHAGENVKEFSDYIIPLLPFAYDSIELVDGSSGNTDLELKVLQNRVVDSYKSFVSEISIACIIAYANTTHDFTHGSKDISDVLNHLEKLSGRPTWQLRLAVSHYLRCFQDNQKFLFSYLQTKQTTKIVARLLSDDRQDVASAAMEALTGILASTASLTVVKLVEKYSKRAHNSIVQMKKLKKSIAAVKEPTIEQQELFEIEQNELVMKQQTSVYFLCAAVLAKPYDTPKYIPLALKSLSKHSYERNAPLALRETVKMCCAEYKRTHMSDNWEVHKKQFTQDQLEAFQDVVSIPHYYA